MRTVKLLGLCIIVIGLFSTLYYGVNRSTSTIGTNYSLIEKPTPNFNLPSLENEHMLNESIFVGGGYKLLNVWASWCAVCKAEYPLLIELAESGVPIWGLNYRDNKQDALKVIQLEGNPYQEVIYDFKGELALDLGVIGTPETFLIDKEGKVIMKISGVIDSDMWADQLAHYF